MIDLKIDFIDTYATSSRDDKCDCGPDEYDYEPEYTIQKTPVLERKCEPCSFLTWKPKEVQLMDPKKSHLKAKAKSKKKRTKKECFPEMVLQDDCPVKKKRTPPKWNEVFPNNVCMFKCKTKVEDEKEKASAKVEEQVIRYLITVQGEALTF